ncbi:hypothetical protein QYZ44_21415 [Vibrio parahaemolyticus]|nr:hypothetical protein [Vibrio parahaemolyticus]MDN4711598.1 hypothetical protein [Vibrio parahaemolyticus]
MNKYYLHFASEQDYLTACESITTEDGNIVYPQFTDVVAFNNYSTPTGELDESGEPVMQVTEGFFVNVLGELPDCLSEFVIEAPDTPFITWQGVE